MSVPTALYIGFVVVLVWVTFLALATHLFL